MFYVTGLIAIIILIIRLVRYIRRVTMLETGQEGYMQGHQPAAKPQAGPKPKLLPRDTEHLVCCEGYFISFRRLSGIYRLLGPDKQPVFDRSFTDITYSLTTGNFICCHFEGCMMFNPATGKILETGLRKILTDEFGHYLYRSAEGYGILDDELRIITADRFSAISGIARGLFKVKEQDHWLIIDSAGNEWFRDPALDVEKGLAGSFLVRLSDGRLFLHLIDEGQSIPLPYDEVHSLGTRVGGAGPEDVIFYRASVLLEECVPGTAIQKRRFTILDLQGRPVFDQQYDWIHDYFMGGAWYFVAITGDWQLFNHLADQATTPGEALEGNLLYSVLRADGEQHFPAGDYVMVAAIENNGLFLVNRGGQRYIAEDLGPHGEYFYWEVQGGYFGVLNLQGAVVIPLEWPELEYAHWVDGGTFFARKSQEGEAVRFDKNGTELPPA